MQLAGKIDGTRQGDHHPGVMAVEAGRPGEGIELDYVEPVRKLGPSGEIRLAQPVLARWEPYPGAAAYRLQLVEQKSPRDYDSHRRLFEWRERPIVSGTSADLGEHKVVLRPGYHYTIEIEALDERKRTLSRSPRHFDRADFRVVE